MTVQVSRLVARMAAIGVLALALGLAACGRKGGLELPPSAAIDQPPTAQSGAAPDQAPGQSGFSTDGRPMAQPGAKKRLPMDPLVD